MTKKYLDKINNMTIAELRKALLREAELRMQAENELTALAFFDLVKGN